MEAHDIMARIDALETRCPKLGHEVTFGYCRREANALPCPRALGCWSPRFPVALVLRRYLGDEAYAAAFEATPKSRVQSLMEAIEAAKQRCSDALSGP